MELQTYFTFPDGALRYDCQACGQRCCRGKGFAISADELTPLLRRAPRLSAFLRLRPGGSFFATDLTDGCFFLAGDGNCALEVQHGRDAKPSTCRLFPFNRIYRAAAVRVIDFNATLCPLQVAAPGTGVRHAELLAEVTTLAQAGSPLIDVPLPPPPGLPEDWLAREQEAQAALLVAAGGKAVLEDVGQVLGGDAAAGVGDGDRHRAVRAADRQVDLAGGGGRGQRVLDEV